MWVQTVVQQLAVVADDQGRVRVFLQPRLQPQRAFQVEVVGRFVEQQQVGLGEQGRGQGHAHPPAAGELGHRALLGRRWLKPRPARISAGAGGRASRRRCRSGGRRSRPSPPARRSPAAVSRSCALDVGLQHGVQHADGRGRVFLVDRADARGLGQADLVAAGGQLAQDQLEQGRLADAVAADQADLGARRQADARRRSRNWRPQASKVRSVIWSMGVRLTVQVAVGKRGGRRYKPATLKLPNRRKSFPMTERTFSIIKPDATRRNLTGKINAVIEDAGLRIVAQRRIKLTDAQAEKFYEVHTERPFYGELVGPDDLRAGRRAGAGRRQRRRQVPRSHGRHQPGQRRRRHHPQAVRPVDRRELGPRFGQRWTTPASKSPSSSPTPTSSAKVLSRPPCRGLALR